MPPKPKTALQRQQIRTAILNAARDLFVERGVEAATMREVARRMNFSATAIYLHFKDKETLIRELCTTDFLTLAHELRAIETIADPIERLRLLGMGYVQFAITHPNHYRLMFMSPQIVHDTDSSSTEPDNPEQDAYASLYGMVVDAHAANLFRAELINPELIAQTLWAGLHGICALEITMKNDKCIAWCDLTERVALMQGALMRGLLRNHGTTTQIR